MINKQLLDYVQKSLEDGHPIEQISPALMGQGWNQDDIKEAAMKATEAIARKKSIPMPPPAPPQKSEWNIEVKNLSASQVLLYLGGLIVVLAGVIYIGINWSEWGSGARIAAIFLPMLICYVVGMPMWFSGDHKKQGIAFLVVGSLLFPFFLSVTFKELGIFVQPYNDQFSLAVSALSLLLYVISSFIFRYPAWAFLYDIAGLFTYYFFLKVIGVESIFMKPVMAWLFLILGTAYLLFSGLYERMKQDEAGRYSYAIGAIVIALSFVRLFMETFNNDANLSWLLLIFGIAYFALGMFYEKNGRTKYTQAPYVIGVGIVFFSLLRLGFDGTLLKNFTSDTVVYNQDIVGWSNVIIGIAYLLMAYVIGKLKDFQFEEASKLKDFFDIVAPLWILGALFYLGTGGQKPVYETLLLISSLGFIFGSIPKLSKHYLLFGTVFLIIYIFDIGAEYFQNQVGWPITLFVAGLLSMGIGVAIERVRRKYFAVQS